MYHTTILYTLHISQKPKPPPYPLQAFCVGKRGACCPFARFYGVFLLLLHNFTTLSSYLTFPISFMKILIYGIRA